MAKLTFFYGAMNSGKTTALLQSAYNYSERGLNVLILKSMIDTKGNDTIVSRLNISRKVDIMLLQNETLTDKVLNLINGKKLDCLFVDEAQFLTRNQVDELWRLSKLNNITVICYGLKADFKTNAFQGSTRLFEVADHLTELQTICYCGEIARFNTRKVNNQFVFDGDQVAIDGEDSVTYVPLCGKCYIEELEKAN